MTEPSHATSHYVKADGRVVFHQSPQLPAVRDQLWDAIELHDTGQADSYTTMRQLDALVKQEPRSIPVHEELGGLLYDQNDWHGASGDCEIPPTGHASDRTARTKTRTAGATLS